MYIKRVSFFRTTQQRRLMLWFAGLGFSLDDDEDINPIGMTSADEELSVDLLRYIGEMLFELFSILCSVIYIIKILFITHTCTTAYNIHIYVFYVQHYVEYANYICIKGFVLPYFVLNIHIYVYLMHLYMGV